MHTCSQATVDTCVLTCVCTHLHPRIWEKQWFFIKIVFYQVSRKQNKPWFYITFTSYFVWELPVITLCMNTYIFLRFNGFLDLWCWESMKPTIKTVLWFWTPSSDLAQLLLQVSSLLGEVLTESRGPGLHLVVGI